MEQVEVLHDGRAQCRMCDVLAGAPDAFDSAWLSDSEYKALVSVGAMVPGWSLVFPTKHCVNLASLYKQKRFWEFAAAANEHLQARYGRCAVFEHGARTEASLTGCGVGHAHLHLVPLDFSLAGESLRYSKILKWRTCRAADVLEISAGREYLFVADGFEREETTGLISILGTPQSQFFRRVISSRIGLPDFYDYKAHPMLDIARASARELRDDVSVRIGA